MGHLAPEQNGLLDTFFNVLLSRGHVAVTFFVVMSGFVMQLANGSRPVKCDRSLVLFYAKRFDRILLTFFLSTLVDFLAQYFKDGKYPVSGGYVALCFTMLAPWVTPRWYNLGSLSQPALANCPNDPSWAIGGAFLVPWLLYPLMHRLLGSAHKRYGWPVLLALCAIAYLFAILPDVVFYAQHGTFVGAGLHPVIISYFFPPRWILDFFVGVSGCFTMQALLDEATRGERSPLQKQLQKQLQQQRYVVPAHYWLSVGADLSFVAVLVLMGVKFTSFDESFDPLFVHVSALPIVVFLALSSAGPRKGIFGTFFAHPAFVALGRYAFAVYLWTVPLKDVLQESKVALVFMIVVFIWSGLYTHFIEEPVSNWLRARLKAWLDASR